MTILVNVYELPRSGGETRVFEGSRYGDAAVSFFLVELPPGDGPEMHSHPYEEVFVIREGNATFTVGETVIAATAGQILVAPARTPHKFFNSGDTALRSINIHPVAAMVTDWLEG